MIRNALLLLIVAALLAACTGLTPPSAPHLTLMVSGDPAQKAAYEELIAAFRRDHAQIDVSMTVIPSEKDYLNRLAADVAAGTPPDVVLLNYRRYAGFAAKGVLEPLGPYLSHSVMVNSMDFYVEARAPYYFRGSLTCIPINVSSLVVYYNKSLFDQAGLSYPKAGWTWNDFLAAAQALTRDTNGDGEPEQYGADIEPALIRAAPFIWQNGGELVFNPDAPTRLSLDKPEAMAALQWFVDLQVKYHVVPNAVEAAAEAGEARFQNGRTGMYFDSRRAVPSMRAISAFDWDVAPLPQAPDKQPATILHSEGLCMPSAGQNKAAAWTFIEFASSAAGQTILARTGRTVPSLKQVATSPAFLDPQAKPASSQVWLDVIPYVRSAPVISTWSDIEEIVNSELERAFYGNVSLADAIASANTRSVEFLKLSVELQPTPAPGTTPVDTSVLPECASHVRTVAQVPDFPKDFPFPPGAVFLQSYSYPETGGFYSLAVVPRELPDTIKYYQDNLPATGYVLAPGDAEPGEVDLVLAGNGRTGNLRAGVPLNCEAVTIVEVSFN